ncbi:MAG: M20 family metallopeptidase [Thermodesulfobacteriota bacterium]
MDKTGIQPARLKRLFQRLVDIYSPSGKEEEVLGYLRGRLKRHGLPVKSQPVNGHRYNLVVAPENREIRLALIGHVDTVSAPDLDTYGYRENGDTVRGLGTADMKGGCAALIEAFLAFHEMGGKDAPAALCLVVGEEETGDGARRLARDYPFPWAIIGEPTDLAPCLGSYGYLEVQVETRGRRMHASMAGRRDNAIEALLQVMLRISRYMEQRRPEAVYNIRDLFSSRAGFAVPERCEAWLDLHLDPAAPIGEVMRELEAVCLQKIGNGVDIQTLFRVNTIDPGYALPDQGPVPAALRAACEHQGLAWAPAAFRSHSDANQLRAAGVKPLILGPGQLEQAHTLEESVSFAQVRRAADLYLDVLCRLFPI